ncbi:MAG: alpha/beta fold hydrolase [Propionivibrio sp.]
MTLPDLALIHGWGLGPGVWQPCAERLDSVARIHRITLPGYGDTPDRGETFVEAARSALETLPDGVTLCGWSLGGLLAMQAALLAPERVARLILVGSTPSFAQRDDWIPAQSPSVLAGFAEAVASNDRVTLQRFVALFNQGDTKARAIGREINQGILSSSLPPVATLLKGLDWLRDIDLRAQVSALCCPVLLIHGENDPLMPLPAARWLAEHLPQSQLEVLSGAAHAPFLNDPDHFATLVGRFIHAHRLD